MPIFVFLCDVITESECLTRKLVGTTQQNALWALDIRPGDTLFLYNFESGILHGPLTTNGGPDRHAPEAWGGRFPVQVPFNLTKHFRSIRAAEIASAKTLKTLRRGGPITDLAGKELFP